MSPVGHTLTGLTIGYLAAPNRNPKTTWLAATAFFANASDLPFPYWGHDRYDISHSIFSTTVAIVVVVVLSKRLYPVTRRLAAACAIAWYSHLLLDTLYNHGQGLAMFWPISKARIAMPIPWFNTLSLERLFSLHNLKVCTIELLVYGTTLCVIMLAKGFYSARLREPDAESA